MKKILDKFGKGKMPEVPDDERIFKCVDCERMKYFTEIALVLSKIQHKYRCKECERARDIRIKKKTKEDKEK